MCQPWSAVPFCTKTTRQRQSASTCRGRNNLTTSQRIFFRCYRKMMKTPLRSPTKFRQRNVCFFNSRGAQLSLNPHSTQPPAPILSSPVLRSPTTPSRPRLFATKLHHHYQHHIAVTIQICGQREKVEVQQRGSTTRQNNYCNIATV